MSMMSISPAFYTCAHLPQMTCLADEREPAEEGTRPELRHPALVAVLGAADVRGGTADVRARGLGHEVKAMSQSVSRS